MKQSLTLSIIVLVISMDVAIAQQVLLECGIKRNAYDIQIPTQPRFLSTVDQTAEITIDPKVQRIVSIPREYVPGCSPLTKEMEISTACECKFEEQSISCTSSTKTSIQNPTLDFSSGTTKVDFTINRYSGAFSGMAVHDRVIASLNPNAARTRNTLITYEGRCAIFEKKKF